MHYINVADSLVESRRVRLSVRGDASDIRTQKLRAGDKTALINTDRPRALIYAVPLPLIPRLHSKQDLGVSTLRTIMRRLD